MVTVGILCRIAHFVRDVFGIVILVEDVLIHNGMTMAYRMSIIMDFVWPSVINYNWDVHPVVNIFHAVDGKRVLKRMVDGGSLLIRVLVFDSNLSYLFPPLLPRLVPVASGQVVKMAPYIMIGIGISCVNITNASLLSPHKPVIPARKVVYTPRGGWGCGNKSCSDRSFVDRCLIYRR